MLASLLGDVVALPVQEAGVMTRCCEVIRNGMVIKRTCTDGNPITIIGATETGVTKVGGASNRVQELLAHGVDYRSCRRGHS